jgi:hypothetical protein
MSQGEELEIDTTIADRLQVEWEGAGMDTAFRIIDTEEEVAEFLYDCDEYFI